MLIMSINNIYLIAQNIRSLYNVGAIFRCADCFGVKKVYLGGFTGSPPRKEISKTALGADNWIAWEKVWHTHKLIPQLKAQGIKIVALETGKTAIPLPEFKPSFPLALIVGNEKRGISPAVLRQTDEIIEIPMVGRKESLNVGIATGVALYGIRNKSK